MPTANAELPIKCVPLLRPPSPRGEPNAPADLLAILEQVSGFQGAEIGHPANHPRTALGGGRALFDHHLGQQLRVDIQRAIALLVTTLLVILAHAIDRHIDPAIVLDTADIHRQPWVLLADGGVDARRLFQHLGGMTRRVAIQLFAPHHTHRARQLNTPNPAGAGR